MKYVMFEHAGSGNHGCEAIVRSTQKILGANDYFLQTFNKEEDIKYNLTNIRYIECKNKELKRNSFSGYWARLLGRINPRLDYNTYEAIFCNKEILLKNSIALSIGGDNYSYRGIINSMRSKITALEAKHIPMVLWGCSVDKDYLDEHTISDLNKYSLITARESLTIDNLAQIGIEKTVVSCSDPAFTLDRQAVSWHDDIMQTNNVIGINVSDLMKHYNAYPQATLNNFYRLIEYLLKETDSYIALIPHVRQKNNDDLLPTLDIAKAFNNERILVLSEEYNCMQLKDVIARCRMFIGCRTHSTIAAYSTCVPTLVVGYSIKAKGIAKDIFGNYNDHIIDVREFDTDYDLTKKVQVFIEKEQELRKHLQSIMPEYIQKAYLAKDAVEKLIKNR